MAALQSNQQLQIQNENPLPSLVRKWVHYDNMASKFSKESSASRKLRDDFESQIIRNLRSNNMEKATIQIGGGQLQCVDEKQSPGLTFDRLGDYLHSYFKEKGGHLDETEAILRYIKVKKNESCVTTTRIKKTNTPPHIPGPV